MNAARSSLSITLGRVAWQLWPQLIGSARETGAVIGWCYRGVLKGRTVVPFREVDVHVKFHFGQKPDHTHGGGALAGQYEHPGGQWESESDTVWPKWPPSAQIQRIPSHSDTM